MRTFAIIIILLLIQYPAATASELADYVRERQEKELAQLKQSAEGGDTDAQYELARRSYKAQYYKEAAKWFRMAAEGGDVDAQYILGGMYYDGQGIPQDYREASKWYQVPAERGYVDAQFYLGWMYDKGQGVSQNHAEAAKWYREAAIQGDRQAQFNLASLYYYGQGVTQDYVKAIRWLKPAANDDDVDAIFNVGATYEAMRNYTEAITWYEHGLLQGNQDSLDALESLAEQDHAEAQYRLAVAYEGGVGPAPKDRNQALKWYHQSAEAGYVIAQYHLGQLFYDGRFILQDYKEALKWYELAARQGMRSAQHEVAQMYKEGTGVKQDYVKAHAWMNLAGAARERALIERNLTTEQVIEAQALARRLAQRYDMGNTIP